LPYDEYDLSKMASSKGGLLLDRNGGNGREIDEETCRLEQIQEKERVEKNEEPHKTTAFRSVIIQHLSVLQCDLLTHHSIPNVTNGTRWMWNTSSESHSSALYEEHVSKKNNKVLSLR